MWYYITEEITKGDQGYGNTRFNEGDAERDGHDPERVFGLLRNPVAYGRGLGTGAESHAGLCDAAFCV